jgi:hypothetical protein
MKSLSAIVPDMGHKRNIASSAHARFTSKSGHCQRGCHVRFVPKADIGLGLRDGQKWPYNKTDFAFRGYVSIRSTHCARQALASKGSAKYCVSRATLSALNSIMLTV